MDRDFSHTNKDNDGGLDQVKRFESYTSKIPVEKILDSKNIERTYKDGILSFEIKFA